MGRKAAVLSACLLLLCLAACMAGNGLPSADDPSGPKSSPSLSGSSLPAAENGEAAGGSGGAIHKETEEGFEMDENTFYVGIGDRTFTAALADTPGAQALKELLAESDVTIRMSDYAGFEKVGPLGQELPASDAQTTAQAGDIVLYQGNQIVMFYGSNSWSYTRLGKIVDLTGWEEALGSGDISATFSLTEPQS